MRAVLDMPTPVADRLFDTEQLHRLRELVDLVVDHPVRDLTELPADSLAEVELVITGWGSPRIGTETLSRMPALRLIIHTAGTVRFVVGDAVWSHGGITVISATEANAVPVAEYTLAQVLLAGKRSLAQENRYRRTRESRPGDRAVTAQIGNYGAVVGLIGASRIGTLVAEHLQRFDVEVLITDPFVSAQEIAALGASKVEPEELYSRSDVVSLHAPDVPSTRGMVSRRLLALMRDGTTFINTARPALVDTDALREELVSGRLAAVLDVNDDLAADDPLWQAPHVSITPHIAGSQGNELHRMGEYALEEIRRAAAGIPPRYPVDPDRLAISA